MATCKQWVKKGYLEKICEWSPLGRTRKRKGRPRNSQMQEFTTGMREKEINMEWVDREEWRRKIRF